MSGRAKTHNHTDRVLVGRDGLLVGVIDDKVQEDVEAAKDARHLAASLDENEDPLVHELGREREKGGKKGGGR